LCGPEEIMQGIDDLTIGQLIKLLTVAETPPGRRLRELSLPVKMNKPYHQPHLENFFDAIRGKAALNCPAEVGYQTAVAVLKINEAIKTGRKLELKPDEFVVYNPHKKSIEHIAGTKLPNSVRHCRYHSESYGMGSGATWGYFEISRKDLPVLLNTSDYLPDASKLSPDSGAKFNIEKYAEQTSEKITWWKPLSLRKRQYAQEIVGSENVTDSLQLLMYPAMDICVGEIREDWLGVYLFYHD